jgi:ABC-type amino acid transport substrate-binding protein
MALTGAGKGVVLALVCLAVGGGIYGYKQYAKTHQGANELQIPSFSQSSSNSAPVASVPQQTNVMPASFKPQADSLASITQNCVVRVSVENPSEPIYGETNGMPHGFNYDFAKLLFAQPAFTEHCPNGVTVDTHHEVDAYENVPRQLLLTQNGGSVVDIGMDGLTFSDNQPVAGVIYTKAYLTDFGYSLIVQNNSTIRSTNDLNGKVIGVLQGDPDVKAFVQRKYPGAQIKEVSDSTGDDFIIKAVDNGDVDAFIYDYPFAVKSIANSDLKFAVSHLDGSDISYKIAVRSNDQNLLFALNSAIDRVMQTPEYTDLMRKYFISSQISTVAATGGERTYTVKSGDTLALIARSQMGSPSKYRAIQKRNNLPNPNLIMIGQQIVIPNA